MVFFEAFYNGVCSSLSYAASCGDGGEGEEERGRGGGKRKMKGKRKGGFEEEDERREI